MACLGDPSRFKIVQILASEERYVLELADLIGLSQSCTTRHLQALVRVGLVARARRGKRVMFRLRSEEPAIGGLVEWVLGSARTPAQRARRAAEADAGKPVTIRTKPSASKDLRREVPPAEPRVSPVAQRSPSEESTGRDEPNLYDELEDFLL